MFDPSIRALFTTMVLLQDVYSVQEKEYLYLGPDKILELPGLDEVECDQDFPLDTQHLQYASAAVVPYGGADTLMLCGTSPGTAGEGCRVWREDGWELSDTTFRG